MSTLILHARGTGEGVPLPLVLAGHPAEVGGLPAHYVRKKVITAGEWVHRGTKQPFAITRERLDSWVESFKKRLASGIKPFVPDHHTEDPKAGENHGYVVGLERNGDDLYADVQLIGDDALALAAKNDVSVYVKAEGIDAKGNPSGEHVQHVALTPNPNQPHLGPFVTIAASAGGSAVDVPVYESAAAQQETPMLKPETLTALRTKLPGLKSGATDAEVAEAAAAFALNPPPDKTAEVTALSASVTTLTKERDDARTEADTHKAKVLSLSAIAPQTDPMLVTLMGDQFDARCEAALEAGAPKAFVDTFSALLKTNDGKPNTLALSACAIPVGEGKVKQSMFGMAAMDVVAKLYKGGFGQGVQPGHVAAANVLALTGASEQTPEQKQAAVDAELSRTELGRRALDARKAS